MAKRPNLNPSEIFGVREASLADTSIPTYDDIFFPDKKKKSRWDIARAVPWVTQPAPHQNRKEPRRAPRAKMLAYNQEVGDGTLVVRFWDDAWIKWEGVPASVWSQLRAAPSTGTFLWNEGFDRRNPEVGLIYAQSAFDPSEMDENTKVMFNE